MKKKWRYYLGGGAPYSRRQSFLWQETDEGGGGGWPLGRRGEERVSEKRRSRDGECDIVMICGKEGNKTHSRAFSAVDIGHSATWLEARQMFRGDSAGFWKWLMGGYVRLQGILLRISAGSACGLLRSLLHYAGSHQVLLSAVRLSFLLSAVYLCRYRHRYSDTDKLLRVARVAGVAVADLRSQQ